jgi:hypothetical protein
VHCRVAVVPATEAGADLAREHRLAIGVHHGERRPGDGLRTEQIAGLGFTRRVPDLIHADESGGGRGRRRRGHHRATQGDSGDRHTSEHDSSISGGEIIRKLSEQ